MTCWSIGSRHQRTLGYFLLARLSPTLTSLMTLPLASAVWNKGSLGCFLSAKLSPTFGSFCLALIGALVRSVCDNICLAFKETFGLTVLLQELLCRITPASSSRDSASTLRDGSLIAAAGSSLHGIASIILFALIVAAVRGGDLILKRRLQSRLDISAAPRRSAPTVPSLP